MPNENYKKRLQIDVIQYLEKTWGKELYANIFSKATIEDINKEILESSKFKTNHCWSATDIERALIKVIKAEIERIQQHQQEHTSLCEECQEEFNNDNMYLCETEQGEHFYVCPQCFKKDPVKYNTDISTFKWQPTFKDFLQTHIGSRQYILVKTNGYSIEEMRFPTLKEAQQQIRNEYKEYETQYTTHNDNQFADQCYITDNKAAFYNNGNDVIIWKIIIP